MDSRARSREKKAQQIYQNSWARYRQAEIEAEGTPKALIDAQTSERGLEKLRQHRREFTTNQQAMIDAQTSKGICKQTPQSYKTEMYEEKEKLTAESELKDEDVRKRLESLKLQGKIKHRRESTAKSKSSRGSKRTQTNKEMTSESEPELTLEEARKTLLSGKARPKPLPKDILELPRTDSELVWVETDDDTTSDEDDHDPNHVPVVVVSEIDFQNRMAEKKHRRDLRKRAKQRKEQRKEPKRGLWYCVYKRPPTTYCKVCKRDFACDNEDGGELRLCHHLFCNICMREGHDFARCPYLSYVPRGAEVGPGGIRICRCCFSDKCHPGDDWFAQAKYKSCKNCGALADHVTNKCPEPKIKKVVNYSWT